MNKKQTLLTYSLSLIFFPSIIGMQLIKKPAHFKKNFVRTAIAKSPELGAMRKTWSFYDSPQEVVDKSQGKIIIKEEIPLGKRYGTCHNYAFTKTMGIVGKAPVLLNILGQKDYYGEYYLKVYEFFDLLEPDAVLQPGDLAVYLSEDEEEEVDFTHTGIVVGHDCIESKWGIQRAVYQHPIWYVPAGFGNHCRYFRLKMSSSELFIEIQKRLQQEEVKEQYNGLARAAQGILCDDIKRYEQDRSDHNFRAIYETLEFHMNTHLDVADENGITPLVHAKNMGCQRLQEMFALYQAHRE